MLCILADIQCFQGNDPERGIPRWATGFVQSLKLFDCKIIGLKNPRLPDVAPHTKLIFDEVIDNTRKNVKNQLDSARCVYLVLSIFEPVRPLSDLLPLHITDSKIPIAVVIYDLTPFIFPQDYAKESQDLRILDLKRNLFRYADLFLCISQNTAKDLQSLWAIEPVRTTVVGAGISEYFYPVGVDDQTLSKFAITSPYIFCVGRNDPRKKTRDLIEAFTKLKMNSEIGPLQLVITCHLTDQIRNDWETYALSLNLDRSDLVLTGAVSDEELRALYSGCRLFVEPSIYEGFGYPPAEAAACGAVVVTSNTSSFPEVLRNPEAMFDPLDQPEMVALMRKALVDEEFRSSNKKISKESLKIHIWKTVGAVGYKAISQISKVAVMPNRTIGDLAPLTEVDEKKKNLKLSRSAVNRFYSEFQFNELIENEKDNLI
jgi:glycosyltransferase involved in cell wall biosynthesis